MADESKRKLRDSSKTRIEPVFEKLLEIDDKGNFWLPRLLSLPGSWKPSEATTSKAFQIRDIKFGAGNEKPISPPRSLLEWLIRNPKATRGKSMASQVVQQKRDEWFAGSEERISEGLAALNRPFKSGDWHIFETESWPDVFIETEKYIIVIEGKRTENTITTQTTWMPCRHQMLRHLDGAWEVRGGKDLLGFFIVEGGANGDVPYKWVKKVRTTTDLQVVQQSLPHRSLEDQWEIARSFIGVTTWQRICAEFGDQGLEFSGLPDTVR